MAKPKITQRAFEEAVGEPLANFDRACHVASLRLVQSEVLSEARVARGSCPGVGGQHSWVVLGGNCYDPDAWVVDPTLWSYVPEVSGIWIGRASERPHLPHGSGSIWDWGKPCSSGGDPVELARDPGPVARGFLELLGPLDMAGWSQLLHAPVGGWPAAEIVDAAMDTPELAVLVPIDRVGMLTDRNPDNLYS